MKGSDTRNEDVFLIKTHENPSCLSITKPSAASLELTEEASAPKQQIPCLAPSPPTRKARAEMLQPTNGREKPSPCCDLAVGPARHHPCGTATRGLLDFDPAHP